MENNDSKKILDSNLSKNIPAWEQNENNDNKTLDEFISDDYMSPNNSSSKKQIIGGVLVLAIIALVVTGFIYWQKRGGLNFSNNNSFISIEDLFKDSDGDGLTDEEEKIYGSDINKVDSDGDGYSDYEEVNNGYNPQGEGKLDSELMQKAAMHRIEQEERATKEIFDDMAQQAKDMKCEDIDPGPYYGQWAGTPRDMCYMSKATMLNDTSYCKKIKIKAEQHDCYESVALTHSNPKACDKLPSSHSKDDASERDYCLIMIADNKKDISICEKIEDIDFKNRCLKERAIELNDENVCKKIISDDHGIYSNNYACFSKIAKNKLDYQICNNIKVIDGENIKDLYYYETRYFCYNNVAAENKDIKICSAMKLNYRDELYGSYYTYLQQNTLWDNESIKKI